MGLQQMRARIGNVRGAAKWVLAAAVLGVLGTIVVQARAPATAEPSPLAVAGLPVQALEVMHQIRQGGPFRHEKDGTVFGNRERLLPGQKRGYYREYTVPTPGLNHRGARRIVCGGFKPRWPEACYYTEDHYNSFRLVAQ